MALLCVFVISRNFTDIDLNKAVLGLYGSISNPERPDGERNLPVSLSMDARDL